MTMAVTDGELQELEGLVDRHLHSRGVYLLARLIGDRREALGLLADARKQRDEYAALSGRAMKALPLEVAQRVDQEHTDAVLAALTPPQPEAQEAGCE